MKQSLTRTIYTAALVCCLPPTLFAQVKPPIEVTAEGINGEGYIDEEYAFCVPDDTTGRVKDGLDRSIGLNWTAGPTETQSYVIIGSDKDVPTVFDDANQDGKTLSVSLPRREFIHWVLYDIPAGTLGIPAGADSQGIEPHGKTALKTKYGMRGINDFAPYFAPNPDRKGIYAGYDGPCPPWNDELVHHYTFTVYALDIPSLRMEGPATAEMVRAGMKGHVLAQGKIVGKYTLNPSVARD